ncbi:titin-like [Coccinella septempunctata]|uniref:titin-like n=1 Tax=Coccinella septempunctata TaxID=41139 RepID=UPI001D0915BC|nr:titin-like [Coccinella septempunctata]
MMTKCFIFSLLGLLFVCTAQADTKCNLRAIFKTPRRSNYDEFELMERSSFLNEDPKAKPAEPTIPNTFSNARVLLRLGDYKNAVKKNNNNVNTKITLAGPNHNNYYQPPFVHPYYAPPVPPMGYPWSFYYPTPRFPQYAPQYYVVDPSRYVPQYPAIPPRVPIVSPYEIPPKQPVRKPKILINDPIVLDNSVIQQIPIASIQPKSSASNGLNTMTVIPKILIDTVAKQPAIVEELETKKLADSTLNNKENATNIEPSTEDPKIDIGEEPKAPEVQDLKIEEIQPNTQNLTAEEPVLVEVSPEQIQNIPEETSDQQNFQIVELAPAISQNQPPNEILTVPDVDNSLNNPVEDKKEPDVVVEQEILLRDPVPEPAVEPIQPESPPEESRIHNMDHPRVLHPVKLSNNIENVEIVGAGNVNISLSKNSPPTIESCTNTKDFELVDLLKKSLVPFINLKTHDEPKLLVSYPIINNVDKNIPEHPSAIIVESLRREPTFCAACADRGQSRRKDVDIDNLNIFKIAPVMPQVFSDVQESSSGYSMSSSSASQSASSPDGTPQTIVSGYQVSSASGYYEDPTKKIIYRKPTEITVVPPQITQDIPSFVQPTLVPQNPVYPHPQHEVIPVTYAEPRQEPPRMMERSKLLDLFGYLLADFAPTPSAHSRPGVCPYCANLIRLPTVVRCPHCLNYHDVSRAYSSPEAHRSFCPHCMASRQIGQEMWNPPRLPTRCPYCAKYRGELNQLGAA